MRFAFRLFGALLRLLFLPILLVRRARAAPPGGFVRIEIEGRVVDVVARRTLFGWRARRAVSLYALGELVDELILDGRVKGLLVEIRSFRTGMAGAETLRALFARVRGSGREVVVYLPVGGDTNAVHVAMAADRVFVGPQAPFAPLGFSVSTPYLRGALDRAGVVPEVLAHGKYKSAGEQLVRTSMSDPQREQLEAIVVQRHDALVSSIAEGRRVPSERARAMIDGAPYIADEAVAAGLTDGVAYADELRERLAPPSARARVVEGPRYLRARRGARVGALGTNPTIGVVRIHGPIAHASAYPLAIAADESVIAAVRAARKNPRIVGVVLHIDSPGGSALASDRMHHELVGLAKDKPLVACMANVAASGGYYVAAAAHAIVAHPTTITGSIGVVSARVAFEPLLARLGIVSEVIKRGAHADLLDVTRTLTDDERQALLREIDGIYRGFVRVVSEGRKLSIEAVERVAQGRVWTGRDALAAGLVDTLGGFDVALDRVRAKVGRAGRRLLPVIVQPPRRGVPPIEPAAKRAADLALGLGQLAASLGIDLVPLALAWSGERALAWCPVATTLG